MVRCLVVLVLWLAPALASARTIAIAYFDNNTGVAELEPLRKGLADMLITDLSNIGSLQIVERARLNQVLDELKLSRSKFIDPKTAQQLGKGLAAEFIMTGSYAVVGDTMRVDVRVIEVKTGAVAASEKVEGKRDDFFALEKDLVDILIKTLDVKLSSSERGKLRSNATQSFDAWQKYSAGLDAKDRGDDDEARKQFQAALDADPNYRAARGATDRLKVMLRRDDDAKAAALDQLWKSLDPKAADFPERVDQLLRELSEADPAQLKRKIALLRLLAERDLAPTWNGLSRVVLEVNSLIARYMTSPDAETVFPPVCEYLITRYPNDRIAKSQCKLWLKFIEDGAKRPLAERQRAWDAHWTNATLDWELALRDVRDDAFKLFKLYGQKVKRP